MYLDPVCKNVLSEEQVESTETFKGKTYRFCCDHCREQFRSDPEKYIGKNWFQRFLYNLAESNAEEFKGKRVSCH